MLIGDAVSRRPFTRQDAAFDLGADALMER
jgi:hypothetical protein